MSTEIRPAEAAEAARLTAIAHAAKRYWGYDEELIELWSDELTVTPEFIDAFPVFCATKFGEVVGFYALTGEFELEHMWVDPVHIASGIGRALFEHAKNQLLSRGGDILVVASDPNAEGFYLRMGAVPTGTVPSRPEGRTLPVLAVTF